MYPVLLLLVILESASACIGSSSRSSQRGLFDQGSDVQETMRILTRLARDRLGSDILVNQYMASDAAIEHCTDSLDCDFGEVKCFWSNSLSDNADFFVALGQPDDQRWIELTGTLDKPIGPYLMGVHRQNNGAKLAFETFSIPLELSPGVLTFRFWLSPLLEIKVCLQVGQDFEPTQCSNSLSQNDSPGPARYLVDVQDRPFKIIIVAERFVASPGGMVLLDDLAYVQDLECRKTSNEGKSSNMQIGASACSAVACDFERTTCNYALNNELSTKAMSLHKGRLGNPVTGIVAGKDDSRTFQDEYVVAVAGNEGEDRFVLASETFLTDGSFTISFWRYQATVMSTLKVCLDNEVNCPYQFDNIQRFWQQEKLTFSSAADQPRRILFIIENLHRNGYLALDDIQLLDSRGNLICATHSTFDGNDVFVR